MNYTYVIISEVQIVEFKNKNESKLGYYSSINSLKNSDIFLKDNKSLKSFNRTQNWLRKNHPKLMI